MLPIYKGKKFPSNQPSYFNMKAFSFVAIKQTQPAEYSSVDCVSYNSKELIVFVLAFEFACQFSLDGSRNGFVGGQLDGVAAGALG